MFSVGFRTDFQAAPFALLYEGGELSAATHTRGILLAMEGIDGAGKTTQVRMLERRLLQAGISCETTKEPTDGQWGRKIRESARTGRMSLAEELSAFINDRKEHVREVLLPALEGGKVVLVDRYFLSTVAYQGARGMDPDELLDLNAFAPKPDVAIILDVDPALGLRRIRQRGDQADLFEKEEELARAREIFKSLSMPNLHIMDATLSIEALHDRIFQILMPQIDALGCGDGDVVQEEQHSPRAARCVG